MVITLHSIDHGVRRAATLALSLALLLTHVSALYVVNGSSCSLACSGPSTSLITNGSDVSCFDTDFNSTSAGVTFQHCVSCELSSMSFDGQTGQTDLGWALFNMRFTLDECLFKKPQNSSILPNSLPVKACNGACAAVAPSLGMNLLSPNTSSTYDFCADPDFVGHAQSCATCYKTMPNTIYLSNFLNTLAVACKSTPSPAVAFPVSSNNIFTWNPPANFSSINQNNGNSNDTVRQGLDPSTRTAIIIAAPVAAFLLLSLIFVVIFVHYDTRGPLEYRTPPLVKTSPKSGSDKPYSQEKALSDKLYYLETPYNPRPSTGTAHTSRFSQKTPYSFPIQKSREHPAYRGRSSRHVGHPRPPPSYYEKSRKSSVGYPTETEPPQVPMPDPVLSPPAPSFEHFRRDSQVPLDEHPARLGEARDRDSPIPFFERRVEIPVPHSTPNASTPNEEKTEPMTLPRSRYAPPNSGSPTRYRHNRQSEPSNLRYGAPDPHLHPLPELHSEERSTPPSIPRRHSRPQAPFQPRGPDSTPRSMEEGSSSLYTPSSPFPIDPDLTRGSPLPPTPAKAADYRPKTSHGFHPDSTPAPVPPFNPFSKTPAQSAVHPSFNPFPPFPSSPPWSSDPRSGTDAPLPSSPPPPSPPPPPPPPHTSPPGAVSIGGPLSWERLAAQASRLRQLHTEGQQQLPDPSPSISPMTQWPPAAIDSSGSGTNTFATSSPVPPAPTTTPSPDPATQLRSLQQSPAVELEGDTTGLTSPVTPKTDHDEGNPFGGGFATPMRRSSSTSGRLLSGSTSSPPTRPRPRPRVGSRPKPGRKSSRRRVRERQNGAV